MFSNFNDSFVQNVCGSEEWGPYSSKNSLQFTPCFEDIALQTVPKVLLIIGGFLRIWVLTQRRLKARQQVSPDLMEENFLQESEEEQFSEKGEGSDNEGSSLLKQQSQSEKTLPILTMPWLHRIKCTIVMLLSILVLIDGLSYFFIDRSIVLVAPHIWIHLGSLFCAYLFALFLHIFEFYWSYRGSDMLLIFWLSQSFLWLLRSRSLFLYQETHKLDIHVAISVFSFLLSSIVFAVEHSPKFSLESRRHLELGLSSEETANLFSRLSFSWLTPMMQRGHKAPLNENDLPQIQVMNRSSNLSLIFQKVWRAELLKANILDGSDSLLSSPSLLRVYSKSFGGPFFFAALLKLCQDILGFLQPLLLRELLAFLMGNNQAVNGDQTSPTRRGYSIAVTMFLCAILQTVFLHQYFHRCFMFGMQIRATTVTAIYQKSLRLSNAARQAVSIGELVNHMTTDAECLMEVAAYLHVLWSAPFQIVLAIFLLYRTLGYSVFAGVIAMVLMLPLNGLLASLAKRLQTQHMKNKDRRLRLLSEVLSGIRTIKLYAWERCFLLRLEEARNSEMNTLRRAALANAGTTFLWICSPLVVSILTFACYVATNETPLTPSKAFVALALFNSLQFPLSALPMMTSSVVEAGIALQRLKRFLLSPELDVHAVHHLTPGEYDTGFELTTTVQIDRGTFAWDHPNPEAIVSKASPSEPPTACILRDITWHGSQGQLVAIVGAIGSGKSSMLSALLGEMYRISGHVWLRGRVAYVPQQPWLLNASVRDNILFGKPLDQSFYNRVITSCALVPDLLQLPAGDATEVGERGVTLSGGQRQRISLARACYSGADIYILDDPLSAVDAHVARHLFKHVVGPKGILAGYTRLWVTHSLQYLSQADQIVVLRQGVLSEIGTFSDLMKAQGEFAHLIHYFNSETRKGSQRSSSKLMNGENDEELLTRSDLDLNHKTQIETPNLKLPTTLPLLQQQDVSTTPSLQPQSGAMTSLISSSPTATWTLPEDRRVGRVDSRVYRIYASSVGVWHVALLIVVYASAQGASILSNLWLSRWSSENTQHGENVHALRYLAVYAGLGVFQASLVIVQACLVYVVCGIRSARHLHATMLERVLHAPIAFFETTPLGRILNRFSKDQYVIDEMLPRSFQGYFRTLSSVLGILLVLCSVSPWFIAAVLPLGLFYVYIQRYYIATSRELRRLDALARSPVYAHFSETLSGAPTIRAYCQQRRFIAEHMNRVDVHQRAYYASIAVNRWLAIRLESIGALVVFLAALFAVVGRRTIDPAIAGLSIVYALSVTQTLNWMVRQHAEVETHIVAVERVHAFSELEVEPVLGNNASQPPSDWPAHGQVEYRDFGLRYRGDQPPVLNNLNCKIEAGEKIGVVGRTGAGKSSFAYALFRLAGPPTALTTGTIYIDGIDTKQVELELLRTRLTLVPQETMLFSGTLRDNLDPSSAHTDQEIWRVIGTAHLGNVVKRFETGLESLVVPDGENFSVGERQLIALARALLRGSKILVLDEATSAVDLITDEFMRATILRECPDCTVITIAHRLPSIFDSDRVLLMDHGSIIEEGAPSRLLANSSSRFSQLAQDADETTTKQPMVL